MKRILVIVMIVALLALSAGVVLAWDGPLPPDGEKPATSWDGPLPPGGAPIHIGWDGPLPPEGSIGI